jgi:quinol monooxygenase YgiN
MRAARGCELHVVLRTTDGSGTVWVTEVWESEAAHDAALATAAARALTERVMGLVSGVDRRIVATVSA